MDKMAVLRGGFFHAVLWEGDSMTLAEELALYESAEKGILEGGQSVLDNGLQITRASLADVQKRIRELRAQIAAEDSAASSSGAGGGDCRVVAW